MRLRVYIPDLPTAAELVPYVERMESSGWFSNFGPLERAFVDAAAHRLDASEPPAVAATSSGTAALTLALRALELPAGAGVLTPALSFPAAAAAILMAGLTPILADVDPESWTLTPAIARAAGRSVAAVAPVATFGCPLPIEDWDVFATETGIKVVLDAAAAFGVQPMPRHCVVAFSLHATKTLGVGEGGLVAARDPELAERVRRLSNFGFEDGVVAVASGNSKMSEIHAAVGLAQLARADDLWAARRRLFALYQAGLKDVTLQRGTPANLVVRLPCDAGPVAKSLAAAEIETRFWYQPDLALHPAYAGLEQAGPLDVTVGLRNRLIGLPFHSRISAVDVDRVCGAVAEAVGRPS